MDQRERIGDYEDAQRSVVEGRLKSVWTALPAIITRWTPAKMTVEAQPAIRGVRELPDGSIKLMDMPLCLDVPVQFPGGGGTVLTFPVSPGDECLLIFANRHIDAWWAQGGIQNPMSARTHNLSDGMALLGFRSVPRVVSDISAEAAELRTDDGANAVSVGPAGVFMRAGSVAAALTSGGLAIVGGAVTHNGVNIGSTHRHLNSGGSGTGGFPAP